MSTAGDGGHDFIEHCPMCESPYDSRAHNVVECADCSAEASTACCISDDLCPDCREK